MLQAIDIPRFNFIETGKLGHRKHVYFVTTDVSEAADHYLRHVIHNKAIYMTISSIDGKDCIAETHGLDGSTNRLYIQKKQCNNDDKFNMYTEEFIRIVERELQLEC
ncbi:MAG: hypothetical protein LKI80_07390 [Sporolactobacillus sp.]|jgi:hypothetical protein|nr:hypothetical protein [Sporolactobacillus sp.]